MVEVEVRGGHGSTSSSLVNLIPSSHTQALIYSDA
jgi:hypothetical protein